jgi:hypothetical protein
VPHARRHEHQVERVRLTQPHPFPSRPHGGDDDLVIAPRVAEHHERLDQANAGRHRARVAHSGALIPRSTPRPGARRRGRR